VRARNAERRAAAGFSLLEVSVSLVLVALALLLAAELLMDAQVSFVAAAREARAEDPRLLASALRGDFGGAQGVVEAGFPGAWSAGPLTLAFGAPESPSGWARYRRVGLAIERERFDSLGGTPIRRRMLGAVTGWRWREDAAGAGLFELVVLYSEPRPPRWGLRMGLVEGLPSVVPRALRLSLGLRGVGGGW
jgi:prepilin-type N-terminal cleavage/methylation domain-containing protein